MARMKAELRKVCGEGVKGFEDCPPVYHVEFDEDEFRMLVDDPVGVLKELGVEFESVSITIIDKAWSAKQKKWIKLEPTSRPPIKRLCCHVFGDGGVQCGEWRDV